MDDLDELTEYISMDPDSVHLVGKGANGFSALVAKAAADEVAAVLKATISTADQNDMPDSDFAYIEPGGTKDDEGKTVPRDLRHFCIADKAHAENALARLSQSPFGDKARAKVVAAAKKFGIDVDEDVAKAATEGISTATGMGGSPMADDSEGDKKDCPDCKGKGTLREGHVKCPTCDATGKVPKDFVAKGAVMPEVRGVGSPPAGREVCPDCDGGGLNDDGSGACKTCKGSGTVEKKPVAKGGTITFAVDGRTLAKTVGPDLLRLLVAKATDQPDLGQIPGSSDWETEDSANLHTAATMLATVSEALEVAQDREEAEVMSGATDDLGDVYDLSDAMSALEAALGIVSRLAYSEQAEAVTAANCEDGEDDPMAAVMAKAATNLAVVLKAGKRLSSTSEQSLKEAIATLTALLAGDGATASSSTAKPPGDDKPPAKSSTSTTNDDKAGAAGTSDEEDDMTDEQVAKMAADISAAVAAGLADVVKSALTPAAPAPEVAVVETDTGNAELVKSIAEVVKAAVDPLEARLNAFENQPQRGQGPATRAPSTNVLGMPAPLGTGLTVTTDPQARIAELQVMKSSARNPGEMARINEEMSAIGMTIGYRSDKVHDPAFGYGPMPVPAKLGIAG